jgi:hypothetical protein
MPWFLSHFQRLNRCERVKPGSEHQILSGNLSNLLVASLEGARRLCSANAHSDKKVRFAAFVYKRLIDAVRTSAPPSVARSPPHSSPTGLTRRD